MKSKLLLSLLILSSLCSFSQPAIQWQRPLGGTLSDGMEELNGGRNYVIPTGDGGFIVAASSNSNDGDLTFHHGIPATSDCWVFKIDSTGNLEWEYSLGGTQDENPHWIQPTSDGGCIIAASTNSSDGDVTGWHANANSNPDAWVIKLDSTGSIEWEHAYGGSEAEIGESIIETSDGGYVLLATTSNSTDGDVSGAHGQNDFWMVKLNSTGTLLWQKCLGGSGSDVSRSMRQTSDDGFIMIGITNSSNGDAIGNSDTFFGNTWIIKTDSTGNIEWQQSYGGSSIELNGDILQTADGGYLAGASTVSNDGDVSGNHGSIDFWILKLNSAGILQWQQCYGGSGADFIQSILLTNDNGFIATGTTMSSDGDLTANNGSSDLWIMKADSLGNLEWQKNYGGSDFDYGKSTLLTSDGGFFVAGQSFSNDIDVSANHGANTTSDVWVVKLEPLISGINDFTADLFSITLYPNPVNEQVVISFELNHNEHVRFEVVDIRGRIIQTVLDEMRYQGLNRFTLDLEKLSLEDGMFFINAIVGQTSYTRKFIKN